MRAFLLGFALTISPLSASVFYAPIAAAQTENDVAELRAIGAWSQQYNGVMVEMSALFDNPVFNTFLDATTDEAVSIEDAQTALDAWRSDHKMRMVRITAMIENLPPVPDVTGDSAVAIREGMLAQKRSLTPALGDLTGMAQKLDQIAERALAGDVSGLGDLAIVLIERGISSILTENDTLEASRKALPDKTHPNYYLMGVMQDTNLFTVEEMRIIKKSTAGDTGRASRRENIRVMHRILDEADNKIAQARASTAKLLSQFRGARAQLAPDSPNMPIIKMVIDMLVNFERSITVEEGIVNLQRKSLAAYESDMSSDDMDAETERNDVQIFRLIDERLRLHGERARLASSLGG